jgi:hypothetical protein
MAIITCKECTGKVSDTAAICPHCGAAVASPTVIPEKGGLWIWILGVPVGLLALLMVIGLNADPEQTKARRTYELCMDDLAGADRARNGGAAFIAGMCEKMRSAYISKYHSNP